MNSIEKLVAKLCPDGVEFRALGEIAHIGRGKRLTKRVLDPDGRFPVYSGGVTPMGYYGKYNQPANTVTVVKYGTAGFVNYINQAFWANDVCYCIKPNSEISLSSKYLYYSLKNKQKEIQNLAIDAIPAHLQTDSIKRFKIPVPPLEIQQEIVNILDTYSELVAELVVELEAELEARRLQYQYYRDELLNFSGEPSAIHRSLGLDSTDKVEFKALGEVLQSTSNIRWNDSLENEFRYIDLSSVDRITHSISGTKTINAKTAPSRAQKIVMKNDVLFGTTRPMLKRYCLISDEYSEQICSTGFCVLRADSLFLIPKFLFHIFGTQDFYDYIELYQQGANYPAISDKAVKSYRIPIPPLEIQQEIVSILDKFEALVNDISVGLPAEIDARRKQYEYYRDKLLTFKEKV